MHRHDVRHSEQFVERGRAPHPQREEAFVGHVRIVADQVHAERVCANRHLATDAPEPDDAEPAPLELAAHELRAFPSPLVQGGGRLRDPPDETEQATEEQLRDRDRIPGGGVDHRDPQFRRGVDRDVVHPDPRAADDPQPGRRAQEFGGDARGTAPDDRVVVHDAGRELRGGQRRHLLHPELRNRREHRDARDPLPIIVLTLTTHRSSPFITFF